MEDKIMNYQEMKERVRQMAIDYSYFNDLNESWGEVYEKTKLFYKLGKRYGLLTEFRENGII